MENAQPTLRFAIAGTGYVGLSLACLLASVGDVRALDVVPEKVEKINSGISPIADTEIEKVLASRPATLQATLDANYAFENRGFIVIATPTNYDPDRNTFDTSSIETVLDEVKASGSTATVVIKSTIPSATRNVSRSSTPSSTSCSRPSSSAKAMHWRTIFAPHASWLAFPAQRMLTNEPDWTRPRMSLQKRSRLEPVLKLSIPFRCSPWGQPRLRPSSSSRTRT